MEIVTAILSGLGGLIGVIRDFLELRVALNGLFKKDYQLSKAYTDISVKDEKVLIDLYKSIEIGKELTERIYKRLAIKYMVTIIVAFLLMVSAIFVLQITYSYTLPPFLVVAFSIGTYFIITKGFPVPIRFNTYFLGDKWHDLVHEIGRETKGVYGLIGKNIYELRRAVGFLNWLTPNESKYLQHYLDLCSLRDTLEMYWIDKKIEETKTYIFETARFRQTFENTLTDIIEDVLNNNQTITNNVDKITNHIKAAGLERFLLLFDNSFFQKDFQRQYDLNKREGIKQIINQYW